MRYMDPKKAIPPKVIPKYVYGAVPASQIFVSVLIKKYSKNMLVRKIRLMIANAVVINRKKTIHRALSLHVR